MGVQEFREPLGTKAGSGTRGRRAGLVCSVSQEKKVTAPKQRRGPVPWAETGAPSPGTCVLTSRLLQAPGGSQDSWATLEPPGLWATEAPRGPKETGDSLVSGTRRTRPLRPSMPRGRPRTRPSRPGWGPLGRTPEPSWHAAHSLESRAKQQDCNAPGTPWETPPCLVAGSGWPLR